VVWVGERGYIVQFVLDVVYQRGCVTRKEIIRLFKERYRDKVEGRSPKYIENTIGNTLRRLVKRGAIVKRGHGLYCRAT
jgi:hypothetical protein